MTLKRISLDDKYKLDTTRAYMTGIEALVRLPILQHQRDRARGFRTAGFISGYRGSPLGGLDQALWRAKPWLDQHDIHFTPGINEDLAATAVRGSQELEIFPGARYDGVFSLWYGKGPGVDRSMDAIRHANSAGSSRLGGVLAVAGDDHAAKSSTLPHQTEHMFIGASVPVLAPANVQEVLDLGIYGWELSRYSGCWVALKAITENMDSAISAAIDPERVHIKLPEDFALPEDGVHVRWPDEPLAQEVRLNTYKIYAARAFARANNLNRITLDSPDARLGIIASGKAWLDVLQALDDLGIDERRAMDLGLRLFKVGMVWPLEPEAVHRFADGVEEILVVEEKRSIVEDQLTGQLYNWPVARRPRVVGEFDEEGRSLLTNCGELTPAMVARALAMRLKRFQGPDNPHWPRIEERLAFLDRKEQYLSSHHNPERVPHFCSGCPHSTSTQVPEGSLALGGIGCHFMNIRMPSRPATTFAHMGGEGVAWVGQQAFTEREHVFQNLGDGTYFHSGILAIRQCLAAGVNITFKLLYNDAVAMTGGQAVDGNLSVEQIILQLRGEGVRRIALVSDEPRRHRHIRKFAGYSLDHRRDLMPIQEELRNTPGTSILIYEQTCAAEKRRRRRRGQLATPAKRVYINSAVCEGCGDCGQVSNCLSLLPKETELGRKRAIDQHACNRDFSCIEGFCPSFVTVEGGELRQSSVSQPPEKQLPEPQLPSLAEGPFNIVISGVGGTGVLTVSALLAMAAHIEGKGCATMNQTGLAQKFGAVVSHVRIARTQEEIHAVRIPAGDADLLLGCDLVVAASDETLAKLHDQRSHAVVNSAETPTAEFVYNRDARVQGARLREAIDAQLAPDRSHFLDATEAARKRLGDSIAGNLLLLGYAWQSGLIPISAEAIDYAIELNGVSVQMNRDAFHWGRHLAGHPDLQEPREAFQPLTDLAEIIKHRKQQLAAYQNRALAELYAEKIHRLQQAEEGVRAPGETLHVTLAAARSLYQLMAFKDEYEVARLLSSPEFQRELKETFSGSFRLKFHLAPPVLFGGKKPPAKREFGSFTLHLLRLLARLRFLRGSWLDPFGYLAERRAERRLLREFEEQLELVAKHLTQDKLLLAEQLMQAPREIRGYGHIKMRAMEDWRRRVHPLMLRLTDQTPAIKVVETA